ncbi:MULTISPECIES: hypothetical protein [unclassified Cryobacterium]|uniref:hypothetical protein n=1 Tax=unclassified Cryobacterium TaxID=2649013 RepID=UPI000CE41049|nr:MULTISPECIES: hypothetical protein [unclassified Cryobacterium]TFC67780.1 hypothetical protein E3O54_08145 [Cryobacterium sp. TMT2-4]
MDDFDAAAGVSRRQLVNIEQGEANPSLVGYDRARRGDLLAHIQGLGSRALPFCPDQLAFDIDLPLPDFYRSVTALDLRGRTQTDVELRDLGLAVSQHQMTRFYPLFKELGVTPASELVNLPGGTEALVAAVRRATHTPPMRSGKRVVFLSLDDGSAPVSNVVFFHDAQAAIGASVFRTHYALIRGRTRRTGARGVSMTGEQMWTCSTWQGKSEHVRLRNGHGNGLWSRQRPRTTSFRCGGGGHD